MPRNEPRIRMRLQMQPGAGIQQLDQYPHVAAACARTPEPRRPLAQRLGQRQFATRHCHPADPLVRPMRIRPSPRPRGGCNPVLREMVVRTGPHPPKPPQLTPAQIAAPHGVRRQSYRHHRWNRPHVGRIIPARVGTKSIHSLFLQSATGDGPGGCRRTSRTSQTSPTCPTCPTHRAATRSMNPPIRRRSGRRTPWRRHRARESGRRPPRNPRAPRQTLPVRTPTRPAS